MPLRHESLIAWQRADDLYVRLHNLTKTRFPPDERFGLTAQLRRAAYSVAANIVEGFGRQHRRERLQFLHTAWGSLQEVGYCLHVARRLGYLEEGAYAVHVREVRRVAAPLVGLMRSQRDDPMPKAPQE